MTLPTGPWVELTLMILGVGAGLLGGGLGGYRLGRRVRGLRTKYWVLNLTVVLGCAVLDFVALAFGRDVLAYSALGLMGGLITGMKYGYGDPMGVWREPGPAAAAPGPTADVPADSTAAEPERSNPAG